MSNLPNGTKGGFEPGLTLLRVRHSTTELPHSTRVSMRMYEVSKMFEIRMDMDF